jgi:hypothetical protein
MVAMHHQRARTGQQRTDDREQTARHPLPSIPYSLFPIPFLLFAVLTPTHATVLTAAMRTPYFDVRYDPADKFLAESTVETAHDELVRVSRDLGYRIEPERPIPLRIYRTHYSFITEGGLEDRFIVGTARTGDERISVDASGAFVTMKQVLAHEITHAVVFRILGSRTRALPLWFNEGLAKYESEEYVGADDTLLANAAADGSLIPLSALASTFPKDNTGLAYAESASAVRYLVKHHGRWAPRIVLAELAATGSFDKAIAKATGRSESAFVASWNDSLSRRFAVLRVWRIIAAFGGAAMAILAVIAFVIRRRRMAQAAREWEWEEFEDSVDRQLRDWPHR